MRTALAIAAGLILAASGCGDDDSEPATTTTAPPTQTAQRGTSQQLSRAPGEARVEVLATGLEVPWDIAFLPDGRALVTERGGRIRVVSRDGRLQASPAAQVRVAAQGEGGLLGIAVDPDFGDATEFVYVYLTRASGMQVRRMRMSGDRLTDDGLVLDGIVAGTIHDSGRLRFGPDGRLYVATGDAGEGQRAQQRDSLNGKILRLSAGQARGSASRPEIFALGLRNPQGLAWQPGSGRLYATDHGASGFDGPSGDDEVNEIRRGANYGWPEVRGRDHGRFTAPVQVYESTIAPSGATFVSLPDSAWTGSLLVAALKGEQLRQLRVNGSELESDRGLLAGEYGRLRAVVEAPDGSIWVTTSNRDGRGSPTSDDDRILRIIPPRG